MLQEASAQAEAVLGAPGGDPQDPLNGKRRDGAQALLRKATYYGPLLDQLEQTGLQVHQRRDRREWSRLYDALTDLQAQLQDKPKLETPPTVILKLLAGFEIMRERSRLDDRGEALARKGRLGDWEGELARIDASLQELMEEVGEVDPNLPDDQGGAQVRRLLARRLTPLRAAINKLEQDLEAEK
jgi:uncharacterized coiled-coil protein SlyX